MLKDTVTVMHTELDVYWVVKFIYNCQVGGMFNKTDNRNLKNPKYSVIY